MVAVEQVAQPLAAAPQGDDSGLAVVPPAQETAQPGDLSDRLAYGWLRLGRGWPGGMAGCPEDRVLVVGQQVSRWRIRALARSIGQSQQPARDHREHRQTAAQP